MTVPTFGDIHLLKSDSKQQDLVRALQDAFRQLHRHLNGSTLTGYSGATGATVRTIGATTGDSSTSICRGKGQGGLRVGHICYPAGDYWQPCDPSVAGAYARGVCIASSGDSVTIQVFPQVSIACAEAAIPIGSTVWPSSTPGVVSSSRPDPASAAFYQEIGWTVGPVVKGAVAVAFAPRVEPEQ